MMNERGKSDRPVVPVKSSNKAGQPVAERMEGRGLTKGNPQQQNASRTQSRTDAPSALERIRQAASKDKETRFTALSHHIYPLEALRTAYLYLKREAAPGVDGETWRHYGEDLEINLQDLSHRLPKADGRLRPLGDNDNESDALKINVADAQHTAVQLTKSTLFESRWPSPNPFRSR
jgi:RNA-directed DNA polymerase